MANILELNVQNRVEPCFIIMKDSSVLYFWQFVMLVTASHYLMLVSGSNNDTGVLANSSIG